MEPPTPFDEVFQKVLRHRTVNTVLLRGELRKKKRDKNYREVAKTLKKRRISIFSSGVPQPVNGCRKLRTRLVKIASDDQLTPVLKKRKVSQNKISAIRHANTEKFLSSNVTAFKKPLIKPLPQTQHEDLCEAADSIISTSIIVQVPHIIDTTPLPSQATAPIEKQHQPNLSVIVYSAKASVTDPSSVRQELTETCKFVNSINTEDEEIEVPILSSIVKKPDFAKQISVIHWIDKCVTVLESSSIKELSQKPPTTVATIINSSSHKNLRYMILFRPIQRDQIEFPYPEIYDKENYFRPFVSLFPMLRINNNNICVKNSLDNGEPLLKSASAPFAEEDKKPNPRINCAIKWNEAMDETLIHCLDDGLNASPDNQQYPTTTAFAATEKGEINIQNRGDNDGNKSMALKIQMEAACLPTLPTLSNCTQIRPLGKSKIDPSFIRKKYLALRRTSNYSKKVGKIPRPTLRDRVLAKYNLLSIFSKVSNEKRRPKLKSMLIKLEVQPNLSNAHHTVNFQNFREPEISKDLNLSRNQVVQMSEFKRTCKACSEQSLVDSVPQFLVSTENCSECSKLNDLEEQFLPMSEDEDSDNAVNILPASVSKRSLVLPEHSMEQPANDHNKTKYTTFLVKKPMDTYEQCNTIQPRVKYPATVVSDYNSMFKVTQPGSADQDQCSFNRVADPNWNESCVKLPDYNSPLNLSTNGFRGFSPVLPDAVFDDPNGNEDIDVCSDTESCCSTPIVGIDYGRQMNYKLSTPVTHDVEKFFKPAMKRQCEPYPNVLARSDMSPYAMQLYQHYQQMRQANTAIAPKRRGLHVKMPVPFDLENVNNDSTLLKQTAEQTTNFEIELMSFPIRDFFPGEDIPIEDLIAKYL